MKKSKITKMWQSEEIHLTTKLSQDLGFVEVRALIRSVLQPILVCSDPSGNLVEHDIYETELTFYIGNEQCKYAGFKELYEKLFGRNKFEEFYDDLTEDFKELVIGEHYRLNTK